MSTKCPKCQTDNPSDSKFCKECAAPLPFSADLSVTKTLETPAKGLALCSTFAGRYQIIEELGKGGMGAVYKALDTQINEEVAIKLIKSEIAADEKTLERFSNELKLARKIAHKNVCKMYHLEKGEETPYISMEYLEGKDLKKLIWEKEKFTEEKAIGIAQQVCEELIEAHRLGVVHRDLEPQNIMIDKDGQAKIMDFGIARSVEAPGVTQTGVIIGTPDYISPEQAEGQEADHRSDIYSLGVILYEMVTGSVPFKGDTALSVALKHKAQLPLDPRKRNSEISDDLSRLILICMEKDRNRRYQTAAELLVDLRNIEDGFPLGTKIRPRRETFFGTVLRKKIFIPAAVVALAVIAVLIWRVLPKKEAAPIPSDKPLLAILYFENFSGDDSLDNWRFAFPELLITDLVQSKYIRVLRLDEVNSVLQKLNLTAEKTYSLNDLKKIAEESQANHLLKGSYIKAGETYKITATLISGTTAKTIGSLNVEAQGDRDIYAKVDELTINIKNILGLSEVEIADDIDLEIRRITSSDSEALKYYMEGERYHFQFEYEEAIASLEKAVEKDPEFAMAYGALAACYQNLGDSSKVRENTQKAFDLKEQLPARERYLLEGSFYSQTEKTYDRAIETLENAPGILPG